VVKGGCPPSAAVVVVVQQLNNEQNTPKEATIKEEKQSLTAKHLLRLSLDVVKNRRKKPTKNEKEMCKNCQNKMSSK